MRYVDQIFSLRKVVEKMLNKTGKKVYATFMDVEKTYDIIDWAALWNVLKVSGADGSLLNGVDAKAWMDESR